MLTRDQIKKNLQSDPYWEPDENASWEEWEVFDEVYEEMDAEGAFGSSTTEDDEDDSSGDDKENTDWDDSDEEEDY